MLEAFLTSTLLGMMIANVPAVLLGQKLTHTVPAAMMRRLAAALFLGTAAWTLIGA